MKSRCDVKDGVPDSRILFNPRTLSGASQVALSTTPSVRMAKEPPMSNRTGSACWSIAHEDSVCSLIGQLTVKQHLQAVFDLLKHHNALSVTRVGCFGTA